MQEKFVDIGSQSGRSEDACGTDGRVPQSDGRSRGCHRSRPAVDLERPDLLKAWEKRKTRLLVEIEDFCLRR